jgi:TonB family protein
MARIEGKVRLSATLSVNGKLCALEVLSGRQELISAAVDAVKQGRFRAPGGSGTVRFPIEIEFRLNP